MRPFRWATITRPNTDNHWNYYASDSWMIDISDAKDPLDHFAAVHYNIEDDTEIRERIAQDNPAVKNITVLTYNGFKSMKECWDFCEERNLTVL